MNKLPWWGNLLGSLIYAYAVIGAIELFAWAKEDIIPSWGLFCGALLGIIIWTRPRYDRKQDFES